MYNIVLLCRLLALVELRSNGEPVNAVEIIYLFYKTRKSRHLAIGVVDNVFLHF